MQNKSTVLRIGLMLSTCLLTASCSDFLNTEKAVRPPTGGGNNNQSNGGTLPEEFQKPNEGPFTEQKMLINIGTNVIVRSVDNFAAQVPVLKNSLRQYCDALSAGYSANREEQQAKMDWKRTMLAFHNVATAPIGPLLDDGRAINDYVYSWPYLNTCSIDKNTLENSNSTIKVEGIFNTRGLYAVEYLLFDESLKTTCNLRANPALKDWNERADQQKKLDRCKWAAELVQDVELKANALKTKWSVEQGNFTKTMIDNSRYANVKEAINALTDSLAAIETLKDIKLGKSLGRHKECTEATCPRNVEHIYSGLSLESAEAQLTAFRAIFTGSYSANEAAFGFDDLLIRSGRQDVAQRMITAIDKALRSVRMAQDQGTLKEQIEAVDPVLCKASTMNDRKAEICAVHADVRDVAFLLKTEVLAALALRAPPTHQGDND